MLEVGTIIGGKFRIEKIIGRGGMGMVAVATHVQLEQRVAIKVLHAPLAEDATSRDRFLREARTPMRLRSDHVCKVFDVGTLDDGAPYIVMELLEGADLASIVAHRPLDIPTAIDRVLQAMIALAEAHAQGIVHRDLKPANLFVTKRIDGSPLVKVLDFGIAKSASPSDARLTHTTAVMGSPGYMSPEQLRSAHDVDARADVWALGAILYELVSGRVPFPATSITELAMKVATDPPQPLAIDSRYQAIVFRCLEKDVARRYQDVGELARDLAPLGGPGAHDTAALIARLVAPVARAQTLPASHVAPGAATAGTVPSVSPGSATAPGTMPPVSPGAATAPGTMPPPMALVPQAAPSTTLGTAAAERSMTGVPRAKRRRVVPFVLVGVVSVSITTVTIVATRDSAQTATAPRDAAPMIAMAADAATTSPPAPSPPAPAPSPPAPTPSPPPPPRPAPSPAHPAPPTHGGTLPPVPAAIAADIEHKLAANECDAAQRELAGMQGTNDIRDLSVKVGTCFAKHPSATGQQVGEQAVANVVARDPRLANYTIHNAQQLLDEHKWGPAFNEATAFATLHPGHVQAAQIATIAACERGRTKDAQVWYAKITDTSMRKDAQQRCAEAHVTLP